MAATEDTLVILSKEINNLIDILERMGPEVMKFGIDSNVNTSYSQAVVSIYLLTAEIFNKATTARGPIRKVNRKKERQQ